MTISFSFFVIGRGCRKRTEKQIFTTGLFSIDIKVLSENRKKNKILFSTVKHDYIYICIEFLVWSISTIQ